jgi:Fur family peroxide stress response transcriptional regulator
MQKLDSGDCMDRFVDHCKKFGLRITPQRCAVYEKLIRSKNHPTAEQLYQAVKKEFPNVSFDTVNRTLLTFAEIGLVEIVQTKGAPRRFDAIAESHHHFNCVSCGKIVDFHDEEYDSLKVPKHLEDKFAIFAKRVVLTGLCGQCRKKNKESRISSNL